MVSFRKLNFDYQIVKIYSSFNFFRFGLQYIRVTSSTTQQLIYS